MKNYIEIRIVVNHTYIAGTHNKPIKIKLTKEMMREIAEEYLK